MAFFSEKKVKQVTAQEEVVKKHTIMIVDDEDENLTNLEGTLEQDYHILKAKNGKEAIDLLQADPDIRRIHLIISDQRMPELTGVQFLERTIPMIPRSIKMILTAYTDVDAIIAGVNRGRIYKFILKPFDRQDLLQTVKRALESFDLEEKNILLLEDLKRFNAQLEDTIKYRTEELNEKTNQLEALAEKLAKYLAPQVYQSIFSGEKDVKIETYKKRLTVFFSDIAGYTNKSENVDLQELTQWLNRYLDEMATVAIRYDGTIDKFIGDAVMIFFGDPQTKGEQMDAIKCVLMAMEMREHALLVGVNIRIGINTGDCIVGNFGSSQRMDYTIIGSAVNLSSRLESNSAPHHILISDSTYELVKDEIGRAHV